MSQAFREFMTGLIDYAGLFPPASLGMTSAVANYHQYRQEGDAWMLGRFICPAPRLAELVDCLPNGFADSGPWQLSGLAGGRGQASESLKALAGHLDNIAHWEDQLSGQLTVPALEIPLPDDGQPGEFLAAAKSLLEKAGMADREIYLEVPAAGSPENDLPTLKAIKEMGFAAKFRCGGVTPEAFPSVERLATVVHGCGQLDLPVKFTAGLHHPVRHQATVPPVMMHGFLNVFGAAVLAFDRQADLEILTACLAETDPTAFSFDPTGFSWRKNQITSVDINPIRQEMLPGFGSCSFDEPREDLRGLGVL